jgi:hypothetical protein
MTCHFQAILHSVCAVVSACFFGTWYSAGPDLRSRVWRRYGLFTALSFASCIAGFFNSVSDVQFRYFFQRFAVALSFDSCRMIGPSLQSVLDCYVANINFVSKFLSWLSVSQSFYSIEFIFDCCSSILVRMCFFSCGSKVSAFFMNCNRLWSACWTL